MNINRLSNFGFLIGAGLLAGAGCGGDDGADSGELPDASNGNGNGNGNGSIVEVSEDIESDTTWGGDDTYLVTDEIDVEARLTIEPGTLIEFEDSAGLEVDSSGILVAEGESGNPITFVGTEASPGWWNGIFFTAGSNHVDNALDHVYIADAGGDSLRRTSDASVIITSDAQASITNSTIEDGAGYGLFVFYDGELAAFEENELTGHEEAPIRSGTIHLHHFDAASAYTGNGADVVIGGHTGPSVNDQTVEGDDRTWQDLGVPYELRADTRVVDVFLTLEAGTELRFATDTGLRLEDGAGIEARGDGDGEDERVVFTGTESSPGWWDGVQLRDAPQSASIIEHALVEYGGADSLGVAEEANVSVGRDTDLEVRDAVIRESANHGVWVSEDATINEDVCTANEFSGNDGDDCAGET